MVGKDNVVVWYNNGTAYYSNQSGCMQNEANVITNWTTKFYTGIRVETL